MDSAGIYVFGQFLRAGRQGGVENYFNNLVGGLRAIDASSQVIWPSNSLPGGRFLAEQLDLLRLGAGIFLFPNYYLPPVILRNQTTTVVIHDLLFKRYPSSLPRAKVAWLELSVPHTIRKADHVVVISEFTRQEIVRYYSEIVDHTRLTVIHNPIDLSRFDDRQEAFADILGEYVLCPSSGFWHKGVPDLIRLVTSEPRLSGIKLVLVGQKPSEMGWSAGKATFRVEYSRLVESTSVIELGFVSDSVLGSLYRGANAVLFPSRYEGFGMPVFEARAFGTPVVSRAVGAVREFVDNGVYLVSDEAGDDEWTMSILRAIAGGRIAPPPWLAQGSLSPPSIAQQYLALMQSSRP